MADAAPVGHWTYAPFTPHDDLEQGDILSVGPQLAEVIAQAHRYFLDPKYTAFVVLTQTCDLVRRGARCRTPYVNLAVVRPLADVLCFLLDRECRRVGAALYLKDDEASARKLLERTVNQNERALGVFYLHPDVAVGIGERAVALLQVSIAVRAREHYHKLVAARCGRLRHEFQSKLGWLVGNLYSRVATRDWDEADRDELVGEILEQDGPNGKPVQWARKRDLRRMQREAPSPLAELAQAELAALLAKHGAPSRKANALDRVRAVLRRTFPQMPDDRVDVFLRRLGDDQRFTAFFK